MARLLDWLFSAFACRHENEGWPLRNHRTCLDCGRTRPYFLLAPFPGDGRKTRQAA